jgi:uncharacterized protein (TIGR02597 family)
MQRVQHARCWSFLPKVTFIITLGLITAATGFKAAATDVFTDPVGFITLTAEGTSGPGSPAYSFLGLGMTQIPALRGVIGTVSGTQVPVNSTLTAGQFNAVAEGPQFYIEDTNTNSPTCGFTDDIISNDTANVYTSTNDAAQMASGDTFKIYPHWTLTSLFGATDQAGLQQGSSSTADQILVQNPLTQAFTTYYYATATKSLTAGWKNAAGNTDASQVPLYGDQGLLINRVVSTNLSVMLVGAVKLGPTLIPLGPLNNFAGNVYATSATVLSNSGLYTDGVQTDSLVAGSASTADLVLIHNDPTGAFSTYYYATATKSLTAGWKNAAGNTDASAVSIPIGAELLIQIQPSHSGFNWKAPAPY